MLADSIDGISIARLPSVLFTNLEMGEGERRAFGFEHRSGNSALPFGGCICNESIGCDAFEQATRHVSLV